MSMLKTWDSLERQMLGLYLILDFIFFTSCKVIALKPYVAYSLRVV